MTENETNQDEQNGAHIDRRSVAKMIGKYAAYTAPAMTVILNADDAAAGDGRRRRRRRRRRAGGWLPKGS